LSLARLAHRRSVLAAVKDAARRLRRFAFGESLTAAALRAVGLALSQERGGERNNMLRI